MHPIVELAEKAKKSGGNAEALQTIYNVSMHLQ
jgi:hypothetical protein